MPIESQRKRRYRILPLQRPTSTPDLDAVARRIYRLSRHELIAEAAYYRSLLTPESARDRDRNWLTAEAAIDALLRSAR